MTSRLAASKLSPWSRYRPLLRRLLRPFWAASAVAALLIASPPARAAVIYWSATAPGAWSNSANWAGGVVPGWLDNAYICNGGTAYITPSDSITCQSLNFGESGAGNSATVQMTGGTVQPEYEYIGDSGVAMFTQTGGQFTCMTASYLGYGAGSQGTYNMIAGSGGVGYVGYGGQGIVNQSGGTFGTSYIGYGGDSVGTYNLNAGTCNLCYVGVSGAGTINQYGGTSSASNGLTLGSNSGSTGTFNLYGGQFTTSALCVGASGTGVFRQDGGTLVWQSGIMSTVSIGSGSGSNGTYLLTSGQLHVPLSVGGSGTGTFTQSGGTVTLYDNYFWIGNGASGNGTYNLNAGQLSGLVEDVGYYGAGKLAQTGGTNTISNNLYLGYYSGSSGTYDLSQNGQLSVPNEYVGYGGSGKFLQSGGTNTVTSCMYIGSASSASAEYNLSGGQLSVPYIQIGYGGPGIYTQTGGLSVVSGILCVGYNSLGTLNLNGGTLRTGALSYTAGYATVNLGGGTLQAGGTFHSSLNMTLTGTGGNANIDTNGNDLTLYGQLSGPGGLNKLGAGTLIMTGTNTYSGGTTVNVGTLQAQTAGSLANYSSPGKVVVNSGAMVAVNAGGSGEWTAANIGALASNASFDAGSSLGIDTTNATGGTFACPTNIGGTLGLTKLGAGTLSLSGANSYSGATNVNAGSLAPINSAAMPGYNAPGKVVVNGGGTLTLPVGVAGAWTAADVSTLLTNATFNAGSTLAFDASNGNFTSADNIAGSLALLKLGTKTLTLTGASTYTGGTTVSAGTLQLGDGNASNGSVTGNIADNAALIFANPDSQTYSGVISGGGSLTASGPGTLTLSGANTFTGGTKILAGTLRLGNAAALQNSTLDNSYSGNLSFGSLTAATLGAIAGSDPLSLNNDAAAGVALTVGGNGQSTAYSGAISGAGSLTKAGAGMLTFTGANTYSGGTTISAGTLQLGDGSNSNGSVAGSIADNAALVFADPAAQTYPGVISGTGSLTKSGGGTLVLTNSNTYSGGTTISAGTLQLGDGSNSNGSVAGNIADNAALVFADPAAQTYSGVISGTGSLTKSGAGTLTLTKASTYTGGTTISAGTLQLGDGVALNGSVAGNIADNAALVFADPAAQTYSGVISGTGSLTKSGGGTLVLTNSNTYSGGTTISAGTLQLGDGSNSNGSVAGNIADNAALVFADPAAQTYSGVISGTGSLTKSGAGTFTLTNANSFSGNTTISAGTLLLGNANALQSSTLSDSSSGTLSFGSLTAATLGALSGSNPLSLTNSTPAPVALTAGGNGQSTTYSGAISGSGSLTKTGAGTFTLTGADTYSGGTTVSGGTLQLGDGGTSNGSVTGNITDNAALAFANPAAQTYSGVISGTGSLTKSAAGALTLAGENTFSGGTTILAGTLVLGNVNALQSSTLDNSFSGALSFGTLTAATLGALSGSNPLSLANATPAPVAFSVGGNGQSTAYSGVISGSGSLAKAGAGTFILTNSNTYSGGTTVSAGTLQLGDGSSSNGSLAGNVTDNATLAFANPTAQTYSGMIGGTGSLTKAGAGKLMLTNLNTYAGDTLISAGTLQLGDGSASNGSLAGNITDNATLIFANPAAQTYSGTISGTGSLTKAGAGALTLMGPNTFTGLTVLAAGTLDLGPAAQNAVLIQGGADVRKGTKLVFDYSGGSDPAAAILAELTTSYNHGVNPFAQGNGGQIFSSTAAGANQALGWKDDAGTGAVTVMQTLYGDANLDGVVNSVDLTLLSQHWKAAGVWASGDFNYDGVVNSADLTRLSQNWKAAITGMSFGDALAAAGLGGTPVPEPGTVALLVLAALGLAARTWFRRPRRSLVPPLACVMGLCLAGPPPTLRAAITSSGNLDPANPATWTSSTTAYVGETANGTLTVNSGSALTSGNSYLGYNSGVTGTATVDGAGSTWTYGSLSIPSAPGSLHIGTSGSGILDVSGGCTLKTQYGYAYIGDNAGSTGSATVTGANTQWLNPWLYVGNSGNGTLNVTNGGDMYYNTGYVGNSSGSTGLVTVSGAGSLWSGGSQLFVGKSGNGTVTVTGGGSADGGQTGILVGYDSGSMGTINVDGAGSTVRDVYVLGEYGSGTLNVSGGATATGDSRIGYFAGSTGTVFVDGPGSAFNNYGLYVGVYGNSTVTVTHGGTLSYAWSSQYDQFKVGVYAGSTGLITIDGVGSSLTNSSPIDPSKPYVGYSGNGTLNITGGATVTFDSPYVAYNAGSTGVITVDGAGSKLTVTSTPYIGYSGNGTLNITGGGTVAANTIIGTSDTTAAMTVNFDGGTLTPYNVSNPNWILKAIGTANVYIKERGARFDTAGYNMGMGIPLQHGGGNPIDGGVTKLGAGTLTLVAGNTYTGGTTVSAGTLTLSGGDNCLATSGAITAAGGVLDLGGYTQNTSGAVSIQGGTVRNGAISKSGADYDGQSGSVTARLTGNVGLLKTGTGTLILAAADTYAGETTISAGTLQLGDGTTLNGSVMGNILDNATLSFANPVAQTYSGVISGTGNVTKSGAGTLMLTSANTYSSGTTISAGTLQLGDGSTLSGSVAGNITDNAVLSFANPAAQTYSGVISGIGSLTKSGAGTLIFTNSNTYSGATTVSAGTLQLGDGNSSNGSVTGNIADNAALVFANPDSQTYAGVISGGGSLTASGPGTLTLAGTNTFTGGTKILAGTLRLGNAAALQNSTLDDSYAGNLSFGSLTAATLGALAGGNPLSLSNDAPAGVALTAGGNGQSTAYSGPIFGAGSLTKSGAGTLTLTGANTYSGGTTISGGTLQLGDGSGLNGSVAGNIANNATLVCANPAAQNYSGVISGSGSLMKSGAGTLTLTNANTYTGGTTVSAGMLQLGDGGTSNGSVAGNITDNAALAFANPAAQTYSGVISGTGSLTKSGAGTLTLTNSNTYTGGTTVSGGTLQLGDGGTLNGSVTGNITDNAALDFANPAAQTYSGVIGGTGNLTKSAAGALTLAGENTFSGGTTILAGTLVLGNVNALQSSTLDNSFSGTLSFGTLTATTLGALSGSNPLSLTNGTPAPVALSVGGNGQSTTYSGVISGSGSLTKAGAGTLILTNSNTYSGGTTASGGTLQLGDGSSSNGSLAGNVTNNATLAFANPAAQTYSGVISGTGSLTKTGAGTLILTNSNTYSGGTTVSAGTLQLGDGSSSNGSLAGNITDNATLVFADPTAETYSGVISGTGRLIKSGAGTLLLGGANTFTGGITILGGTLELGLAAQNAVLAQGGADVQKGTKLVFDYSGGGDPAAAILAELTTSYNHGANPFAESNGGQIFGSTAASVRQALGWKDDAGTGAVTVMQTLYGDANLDGVVNSADLTLLSQHWKAAGDWATGDFNYDGVVNSSDLTLLSQNWKAAIAGMSFGDALAAAGLSGTPVPEPSTLVLLVLTALGICVRTWVPGAPSQRPDYTAAVKSSCHRLSVHT